MKTMMYIHGYGSTGNATKAQLLQAMFPDARLVSPTFDYNTLRPQEVYNQLQEIVANEKPDLILGSSMGGYYALCTTAFYHGTVWCVNPVRDILATIRRLMTENLPDAPELKSIVTARQQGQALLAQLLSEYEMFDRDLFQQLKPLDGQLHFALSTDDELLGDHHPLLDRFPNYGTVVWKDHCGHRFFRFDELKKPITKSL